MKYLLISVNEFAMVCKNIMNVLNVWSLKINIVIVSTKKTINHELKKEKKM